MLFNYNVRVFYKLVFSNKLGLILETSLFLKYYASLLYGSYIILPIELMAAKLKP